MSPARDPASALARWVGIGGGRPPGAVWRLLLYVAALFVGAAVASAILSPLAAAIFAAGGPSWKYFDWGNLVGAVLAHVAMLRWIERRGWDMVGMGREAARPALFGSGAAIGALAIGVPSLLLLGVGQLRAERTPDGSWWGVALSTLGVLAPAALFEELLVRGYPFVVLREAGGTFAAVALTSAVFGVLHLQNPGATAASVTVVALAGVFLAAVLLATGSLWAAFAAHLAWNWTMSGLLHAAVSGLPFAAPDYRVVDAGPDWLTGGGWGPEGGAGAAGGMLLALTYLWRRARRGAGTIPGPYETRPLGRGSE
jgi:membrane protease YdiL (CAAX protease family)